MNNKLELVFLKDEAYVDSRKIAEYYGKDHNHVMRDIANMFAKLDCPKMDSENYKSFYKNSRGKLYPCYHLDFDLTMTLITGYDVNLRYQLIKDWKRLVTKRTEKRVEAKSVRKEFTNSLKEHGIVNEYGKITINMKKPLDISISCSKDSMTEKQLKLIEAAEHVATIVLDDEYGYEEVNDTCVKASQSIADLVESRK